MFTNNDSTELVTASQNSFFMTEFHVKRMSAQVKLSTVEEFTVRAVINGWWLALLINAADLVIVLIFIPRLRILEDVTV
ncbi:hypothetical protein DPMN_193066 [Dreissena polymorpha]|uniref:Uncharacterized protein n=1 Tax=Dreissena polymorpha TaxID=45954 RepID=A0A9D4BDM7_DREPO|nr:hypothetical protein DPMN_193066 [Dreissena polymorpha]